MSEVSRDDEHGLWTLAPEGQVYVCGACGKTSRNRAGFTSTPVLGANVTTSVASPGWDESCMLNAVRCYERANTEEMYRPVPDGWLAFKAGALT